MEDQIIYSNIDENFRNLNRFFCMGSGFFEFCRVFFRSIQDFSLSGELFRSLDRFQADFFESLSQFLSGPLKFFSVSREIFCRLVRAFRVQLYLLLFPVGIFDFITLTRFYGSCKIFFYFRRDCLESSQIIAPGRSEDCGCLKSGQSHAKVFLSEACFYEAWPN